MHTKEKTGILRAERFRDALCDVGFQLSTDILSILILKYVSVIIKHKADCIINSNLFIFIFRYMRRDGTMRLADFVSAILHLTMAFELFKSKDVNQDNQIKLNLNEVLLNKFKSNNAHFHS
jgi:calpain-9